MGKDICFRGKGHEPLQFPTARGRELGEPFPQQWPWKHHSHMDLASLVCHLSLWKGVVCEILEKCAENRSPQELPVYRKGVCWQLPLGKLTSCFECPFSPWNFSCEIWFCRKHISTPPITPCLQGLQIFLPCAFWIHLLLISAVTAMTCTTTLSFSFHFISSNHVQLNSLLSFFTKEVWEAASVCLVLAPPASPLLWQGQFLPFSDLNTMCSWSTFLCLNISYWSLWP